MTRKPKTAHLLSGSIENVKLGTLVVDGQVLGEDSDAAFTFLVLIVHDTFSGFFALRCIAIYTRLTNQGIDQSCFAVIDVGDDGDISVTVILE
jgi:hypothetical protein